MDKTTDLLVAPNSLESVKRYKVVKSNDLIQKTRYSLSVQEQRIMMFLISKIKPDDDDFETVRFSIKDFCYISGISDDSGSNYNQVKNTLKKLADKSFWISINNDKTTTIARWIERPYIHKNSGVIDIKIDKLMKPYLLQLQEKFTQYELNHIISLKSQYSMRIYELLKSYQNLMTHTFNIDDLKTQLYIINDKGEDKYVRFNDFKKNVLDRATNEINSNTDILVSYELKKTGRKFSEITFFIDNKAKKAKNESNDIINGFEFEDTIPSIHKKKTKKQLEKEVLYHLLRYHEIPLEYENDKKQMEMAIHILTERNLPLLDEEMKKSTGMGQIFALFKKSLIDLCLLKTPIILNEESVSNDMIIDKINENININGNYADIQYIQETTLDNFTNAIKTKEIKNHSKYMKSCIWNVLQSGQIDLFSTFKDSI